MVEFNQASGVSSPVDIIPNGVMAWAIVTFRGLKPSSSGGQYLDLELTIDDPHPFSRRKLWEMVGDPDHAGNSDGYKQMGRMALTRILECIGVLRPGDPQSYASFGNPTTLQVGQLIDGKRVAIKIKIERGKDGYSDKNKVGEWLSPNPESSGNKNFVKLLSGDFGIQQSPQQQFGFGQGAPAAQQPPAAGYGRPGGVPTQPMPGFQTPGFQALSQQPAYPATAGQNAPQAPTQPAYQANPAQVAPQPGGGGAPFAPQRPAWLQNGQGQR